MVTKKRTISVRLDDGARKLVEMAAKLSGQSSGAFVGRLAREHAHAMLMDWAVARYRSGVASLSELAGETGLAIEEIMDGLRSPEGDAQALDAFLASCRAIAEREDDPEFLRTAEEAARTVRERHQSSAESRPSEGDAHGGKA